MHFNSSLSFLRLHYFGGGGVKLISETKSIPEHYRESSGFAALCDSVKRTQGIGVADIRELVALQADSRKLRRRTKISRQETVAVTVTQGTAV